MRPRIGLSSSQKGMSLIQTMVALALLGLLISGILTIIGSTERVAQDAAADSTVTGLLQNLGRLSARATGTVRWEDYSAGTSFYGEPRNDQFPQFIEASGKGDFSSFSLAGKTYLRSSSTLTLRTVNQRLDDKDQGALLARCISKQQIGHSFTVDQAMALPRVPVLRFDQEQPSVYCCRLQQQQLDCSGGRVHSLADNWRVRVFRVTPDGAVKIFPPKTALRDSWGAGFDVLFDARKEPSNLVRRIFVLTNACQKRDLGVTLKDCQDETKVLARIFHQDIEISVYESGQLQIGD